MFVEYFLLKYVSFCLCDSFSGGRNIVVTGSGFDLIQTAVMKVQGDNSVAFEVCLWFDCIVFFFLLCAFFFSLFLQVLVSKNIFLYLPPLSARTLYRSFCISWTHNLFQSNSEVFRLLLAPTERDNFISLPKEQSWKTVESSCTVFTLDKTYRVPHPAISAKELKYTVYQCLPSSLLSNVIK